VIAGVTAGTELRLRPIEGRPAPGREIAPALRRSSPRAAEFRLLGEAIRAPAQALPVTAAASKASVSGRKPRKMTTVT
jgi:hypothetical protein